jgi:hypothetical protein
MSAVSGFDFLHRGAKSAFRKCDNFAKKFLMQSGNADVRGALAHYEAPFIDPFHRADQFFIMMCMDL